MSEEFMLKHVLSVIFCLFSVAGVAQPDSSFFLIPEKLTDKDVIFRPKQEGAARMVSATRSLEYVNRLPFNTWVITGEEIWQNGYTTLADVLRAAPGIRTSQPGNAVEGETFLMRGLSGNQFVKILINDIPVKPTIALGMPIGAQLPIRQAERIEVIYGPGSVIYGNEACAGVVNIILKETERPVFAQADLGFGSFGYNSLDLTFGGKLFKDKNILNYSIYGSNTLRERTNIFDEDDPRNFDVSLYKPDYFFSESLDYTPNYQPIDQGKRLAPVPHESRLFGINLRWRGLFITYHRFGRNDVMATGQNPFAYSYANPSNQIQEKIDFWTLGFKRQRNKRTIFTNFSVIQYNVSGNSSSTFVYDGLVKTLAKINLELDPFKDSLNAVTQPLEKHNLEERFTVARGIDFRGESILKGRLYKDISMTLGATLNIGGGVPLNRYYNERPVTSIFGDNDNLTSTSAIFSDGRALANSFAQLEWQSSKCYAMAGINHAATLGNNLASNLLSPRVAFSFMPDSQLTIYANSGIGYRQNAFYYTTNSYLFEPFSQFTKVDDNYLDRPETVFSVEGAIRYGFEKNHLTLSYFWQTTDNLIRPNQFRTEITEDSTLFYRVGYENHRGRALEMHGVQLIYKSESRDLISLDRKNKETKVTFRTEYYLQYARGKEWLNDTTFINEISNQPKWHGQFRMFFGLNRQVEVMFASNRQTSVRTKSWQYQDYYHLSNQTQRMPTFRSWDTMMRFYFSKQFLIYIHVQNIFNKRFGGLDAYGTPDDLFINKQPGRSFRLGVNYNMN